MIKSGVNKYATNTINKSNDAIFSKHIFVFKEHTTKVNDTSSSQSVPSFENKNDDVPLSFEKRNDEENSSILWLTKKRKTKSCKKNFNKYFHTF